MAACYCYCLGIKSNDFFLKDNKKAFILWLNVPKVTAYFYGKDLTYEEVINKMKEHKAINMYEFLKKHKACLLKLKDDALALPLVRAKKYIEDNYGSY